MSDDRQIQAIVIHRSEAGRDGPAVSREESKQGCGYHYFVRQDGTVDCMYPDETLVWHALGWSRCTIAIALYGDFDAGEHSRNSHPTPAQVDATINLCMSLWRKYGVLCIFGHTDLPSATRYQSKKCPGANLDLRLIERETWLRWRKLDGQQHKTPLGNGANASKQQEQASPEQIAGSHSSAKA